MSGGEDGRLRVAIVGGGANGEHEVSLASARAARDALDPARYDVAALTIDRDGTWIVGGTRVGLGRAIPVLAGSDVVLPLVHGAPGEDGSLAALCELLGIRYVGSGVAAGALAMDKRMTKVVASAAGVRTARATALRAGDRLAWTEPVVVKPNGAGSSRGVSLVAAPEDLETAVAEAFRYGRVVLAEEVLAGREIDIAVIERPGGERFVTPPIELPPGLFGYDEKYGADPEFRIPARLAPGEAAELERLALTVFDAVGCRGLARVDFFLTAEGWVLNEVNTIPGMTAHSQVPKMCAAAGLAYPELLELLIARALD